MMDKTGLNTCSICPTELKRGVSYKKPSDEYLSQHEHILLEFKHSKDTVYYLCKQCQNFLARILLIETNFYNRFSLIEKFKQKLCSGHVLLTPKKNKKRSLPKTPKSGGKSYKSRHLSPSKKMRYVPAGFVNSSSPKRSLQFAAILPKPDKISVETQTTNPHAVHVVTSTTGLIHQKDQATVTSEKIKDISVEQAKVRRVTYLPVYHKYLTHYERKYPAILLSKLILPLYLNKYNA